MLLWVLGCKSQPTPPAPTVATDPPTEPGTLVQPTPPPTPKPPTLSTGTTAQTGSTGDTGGWPTGDTGPFVVSCDTSDTGALGIPDCNGHCFPEAFVGDGLICDDGTVRPWGAPDFDCAAFGYDQGDCPQDTGTP